MIRFFASSAVWLSLLELLVGCEEERQISFEPQSTPGEIQVINSNGISGAAGKVCDYLRRNGFDVVETSNSSDGLENYEETIIALRNPHWAGARTLANALHTENVIPLENKREFVDATVYVGKDFEKIIQAGALHDPSQENH